jgi:hypothetical protein
MTDKKVTRDSLKEMLSRNNPAYVQALVGRALLAIFQYQTAYEKVNKQTTEENGVGFSSCDAKSGSLTALSWAKYKKLEPWQVAKWTKIAANGYPRICRYANQLNRIVGKS